jgi:hypothetical protein
MVMQMNTAHTMNAIFLFFITNPPCLFARVFSFSCTRVCAKHKEQLSRHVGTA